MRITWGIAMAALAALAVGAPGPVRAQEPASRAGVAAKVGDEDIRMDEVEQPLRGRLAQLEQQRFELLQQRLDHLVSERLLAQEARRRNVSVDQLLKTEVHGKSPDVTDDEVTAFIDQNRGRLGRVQESELRLKVWDYLRGQKVGLRRQAYVKELRDRTPVVIHLQEPESTRVPVRADLGYARGPAAAPVVIVEFSDFQCPYCKTVVATIKQLLERYPEQVRWVFRDFPLASIHPTAPKAHEAARCAGAQGKFWEYHDVLFERSPRHQPDQLARYAEELKLDATAFRECLESERYAEAVEADIEEAGRLGITGTPTFYVNGRLMVGAQPLAAFQQAVEGELARKAATRPEGGTGSATSAPGR
jgi:protein-disulfide isomerase